MVVLVCIQASYYVVLFIIKVKEKELGIDEVVLGCLGRGVFLTKKVKDFGVNGDLREAYEDSTDDFLVLNFGVPGMLSDV